MMPRVHRTGECGACIWLQAAEICDGLRRTLCRNNEIAQHVRGFPDLGHRKQIRPQRIASDQIPIGTWHRLRRPQVAHSQRVKSFFHRVVGRARLQARRQ